jgi:hypothetical protein
MVSTAKIYLSRKMLRGLLVLLILATGLLITLLGCSTRSFGDLNQEMKYLVSGLAEKDKSVRNCVLSVMKGDGSFSWSGAAGPFFLDGLLPLSYYLPVPKQVVITYYYHFISISRQGSGSSTSTKDSSFFILNFPSDAVG